MTINQLKDLKDKLDKLALENQQWLDDDKDTEKTIVEKEN